MAEGEPNLKDDPADPRWKALDLPSLVSEMTQLFRLHGAHIQVEDLSSIVRKVEGFVPRSDATASDLAPFAAFIFKVQGGEMLVEFPRHEEIKDRQIRVYTRGNVDLADCSRVGNSFVETFEAEFLHLPPNPELLVPPQDKRG